MKKVSEKVSGRNSPWNSISFESYGLPGRNKNLREIVAKAACGSKRHCGIIECVTPTNSYLSYEKTRHHFQVGCRFSLLRHPQLDIRSRIEKARLGSDFQQQTFRNIFGTALQVEKTGRSSGIFSWTWSAR